MSMQETKVDPTEIETYIMEHFPNVHPVSAWGEKSFFLNPEKKLKRGTYFATLKEKDGDNDRASNIDREGIFRLNIGISKSSFLSLFATLPQRPKKGGVIEGDYRFEAIDQIQPHPVYGWMAWICVLNPSLSTFDKCKPLLKDAYQKAAKLTEKKLQKLP